VIAFSDENRASVPELHLAQGVPTTVVFPLNINEAATRLADSQRLIYRPQFFKNTAVLSPKADLPAGALIPLTVGLEDGTLLSFVLRTVPAEADFQVTVEVKFQREVSPESVEGLKQTIAQMQRPARRVSGERRELRVSQIAALVLSQEPQSPTARTFRGALPQRGRQAVTASGPAAAHLSPIWSVVCPADRREPRSFSNLGAGISRK